MTAAKTLTVTVNPDAAAQAAYETFVARNAEHKPWAELTELAHESWRRVTFAVLKHVVAKDEK